MMALLIPISLSTLLYINICILCLLVQYCISTSQPAFTLCLHTPPSSRVRSLALHKQFKYSSYFTASHTFHICFVIPIVALVVPIQRHMNYVLMLDIWIKLSLVFAENSILKLFSLQWTSLFPSLFLGFVDFETIILWPKFTREAKLPIVFKFPQT